MLGRALLREPPLADAARADLLRARGLQSSRQLLRLPRGDVALAADLSARSAAELLEKLSARLAPSRQSALDMFVQSANRPLFLRSGMPEIDRALHGGLRAGGITEFAGIPGMGKSQLAMTLAVRCALEYPGESIVFIDTERCFSAKRLLQIARKRLGQDADAAIGVSIEGHEDAAAEICRRVRVVQATNLADFITQLKRTEQVMQKLHVRLLVIDSVTTLFLKANDLPQAEREHLMLRVTRDLRLLSDTHEAFVVVTNRAVTENSPTGLFTRPLLNETWTHCVTTRVVMERHADYRAMVIVKSPCAANIIQPYTISRAGVEAITEHGHERQQSEAHLAFLSLDDDVALAALPSVETRSTLRSTQLSMSSTQERLLDAPTAPMSDDGSGGEGDDSNSAANSDCARRGPFEVVGDSQDEDDE